MKSFVVLDVTNEKLLKRKNKCFFCLEILQFILLLLLVATSGLSSSKEALVQQRRGA